MTEEFPYKMFPIKLTHKEGKDKKTCWFQCSAHLDTYIKKNNLKPKDYEVKSNSIELVKKTKKTRTKK